ncbi:winged helix-turn-helix domain-containing protein [Paenibacillus larvae]|nr:winged helix-turn-helix domain-containing protein [Paenibacillus larvae]MDT2302959.1 winged helix-turn-helix domain-containing protein [Paenibacillus larvae]
MNRNRMTVNVHSYVRERWTGEPLAKSSIPQVLYSVDEAAAGSAGKCKPSPIPVPHEVGFTAKHNWTLELIAAYVEREWGHCNRSEAFPESWSGLGLSYTKPTYTLAAADPKKQRHFTENLTVSELKKSY